MKKSRMLITYLCLLLFLIVVPLIACATEADTDTDIDNTDTSVQTLYTWENLYTYGGAYAVTLLIAPLLKKWTGQENKENLEFFSICTAFVILFLAAIFTVGLTLESGVLSVVNAFVVGLAVYGTKTSVDRQRAKRAAKRAA